MDGEEGLWERLSRKIAEFGVDEQALESAAAEGPDGIRLLVARHMTFPGARRYTANDVYAESGVDPENARALWKAMGFPIVPDDEPAFTDADIEALRIATTLFERADMDTTIILQQARSMGQATARIAASHQDVIAGLVVDESATREAEAALSLAEEALPALDRLLVYMYRRHLAAATEQRLLIAPSKEGGVAMSIGFADLSGFTALSRELDVREIAALVDRFNAETSDIVTQAGGRVVKTIGDEVMFATHEPASAATIAVGLIGSVSGVDGLPLLKVGVASGIVIAREGDIFGSPVNLANRLVATAVPESVLVDEATRDALAGDPRFRFSALGRRTLKGIGSVHPFRLRAAESEPAGPTKRRSSTRRGA